MLEFLLEDLRVPAGTLGDPVVGQDVGLELLVGQMLDLVVGTSVKPSDRAASTRP
jgi:hypothetical protein